MRDFTPMLATRSGTLTGDGNPRALLEQMNATGLWSFEFKYDGIRALIHLDGDSVVIRNRADRDITHRYPEISARFAGLGLNAVLDGEIICLGAGGTPDFAAVHRRDAQSSVRAATALARTSPAQYVAFDVLRQGVDLRSLRYTARRERLLEWSGRAGVVVPPVSQDGLAVWQVVVDMALEGVVAKRVDGRYWSGQRHPGWVKVKRVRRVSALVTGYDPGAGSRAATFGALSLGLLQEGRVVGVGKVGSGFTEGDLGLVWGMLRRGEHPIVVEVEYLDAVSGQLRQPVFKGVRSDISPGNCTVGQLIG